MKNPLRYRISSRRTIGRALIVLCSLFWLALNSAGAVSLFAAGQDSLFADQKARREGDLVTVIITEQASASQSVGVDTGKSSEVDFGPGFGVLADLFPLMRLGGGDSFSASGSTSRQGSISAQLTTRVTDISPGGTLRLEGRQRITVDGEEQEIVISGYVRERDIAADNTVLSTLVADADIQFTGSGTLGDKQSPGILTRLLNWLF